MTENTERPIQVGDLVVLVRYDHRCADVLLGKIYRVLRVPSIHPGICCPKCGERDLATANSLIAGTSQHAALPQRWLKRIPPLSELEGQRTQEDMKEPA